MCIVAKVDQVTVGFGEDAGAACARNLERRFRGRTFRFGGRCNASVSHWADSLLSPCQRQFGFGAEWSAKRESLVGMTLCAIGIASICVGRPRRSGSGLRLPPSVGETRFLRGCCRGVTAVSG